MIMSFGSFFFFFFKQKTAYEMRISDWSSDVCSSDLVIDAIVRDVPQALRPAWQELAGQAAEANAFAEPWFVAAGLRNLRADLDIHLLQVWNSGDRKSVV